MLLRIICFCLLSLSALAAEDISHLLPEELTILKDIRIIGNTKVTTDEVSHIAKKYIGKKFLPADLAKFILEVTKLYSQKGYSFVIIKPHKVFFRNGILTIQTIEGKINNIIIDDSLKGTIIEKLALELKNKDPLDDKSLDHFIAITKKLYGAKITTAFVQTQNPHSENAIGDFVITAKIRKFDGSIGIDNASKKGNFLRASINIYSPSLIDRIHFHPILSSNTRNQYAFIIGYDKLLKNDYELALDAKYIHLKDAYALTTDNFNPENLGISKSVSFTLRKNLILKKEMHQYIYVKPELTTSAGKEENLISTYHTKMYELEQGVKHTSIIASPKHSLQQTKGSQNTKKVTLGIGIKKLSEGKIRMLNSIDLSFHIGNSEKKKFQKLYLDFQNEIEITKDYLAVSRFYLQRTKDSLDYSQKIHTKSAANFLTSSYDSGDNGYSFSSSIYLKSIILNNEAVKLIRPFVFVNTGSVRNVKDQSRFTSISGGGGIYLLFAQGALFSLGVSHPFSMKENGKKFKEQLPNSIFFGLQYNF